VQHPDAALVCQFLPPSLATAMEELASTPDAKPEIEFACVWNRTQDALRASDPALHPTLRPAFKVRRGRRSTCVAMHRHDARYCQPATHYLLSGLVQCGVCGSGCSSFRRWQKIVRPSGKVSVYHHAAYRCNRRARENNHDRTQIERCTNSLIKSSLRGLQERLRGRSRRGRSSRRCR
jgi:hypothetical protein